MQSLHATKRRANKNAGESFIFLAVLSALLRTAGTHVTVDGNTADRWYLSTFAKRFRSASKTAAKITHAAILKLCTCSNVLTTYIADICSVAVGGVEVMGATATALGI